MECCHLSPLWTMGLGTVRPASLRRDLRAIARKLAPTQAEVGGPRAEDGRRRTEDGRRMAEGGRRRSDDGRRTTESGRRTAEDGGGSYGIKGMGVGNGRRGRTLKCEGERSGLNRRLRQALKFTGV